jgi:hypothetical protein
MIVMVVAALTSTVVALSPVAAAAGPVQVSGNAAWSWWMSPLASAGADGGLTFGVVNSGGIQRVITHDGTAQTAVVQMGSGAADDHNAVAVSRLSGRPTIAAWAGHPAPVRVAVDQAGGVAFGPPQTLFGGATGSYVQIIRDDASPRVVVLSRVTPGTVKWLATTSPDDGVTWTAPTVFADGTGIGQFYAQVEPRHGAPGVLDVGAYRHPNAGTGTNTIRHLQTTFDELYGGLQLDLTGPGMDVTWAPSSEDLGFRTRLLDVGTVHGAPVVAYARWRPAIPTPVYYLAIRQPDGSWLNRQLDSSGPAFWEPSKYVGGIAIDEVHDRVTVSRQIASTGTWEIHRRDVLSPAGELGTRQVLATDTAPLVRPVHDGEGGVLWLRLSGYTHYTDYFATAWWLRP